MRTEWPKRHTVWRESGVRFISVPFTWELPTIRKLYSRPMEYTVVGGPAVKLMPDYLHGIPDLVVDTGDMDGVLQRVKPDATRTTTGCINRCRYCAVGCGQVEGGGLVELDDWPDRPIICDNNLTAASHEHFDRVMDRLEKHDYCEFSQGLDCRYLKDGHALRLARLKNVKIRLACDSTATVPAWTRAVELLREYGVPLRRISCYVLAGFEEEPLTAWRRAHYVKRTGVTVNVQWFHALDALKYNEVTATQKDLGWSDLERKRIMQWYYRRTKKYGLREDVEEVLAT